MTCGYHEVIYTEKVKEVMEKRVKEGGIPWRVSSTMFGHLRHDVTLEPIAHFRTEEALNAYKPMSVYEQL